MNSRKDKREKILRSEDDKISALPDNLLCHILSLLPTKSAACTSILSKRWKDLFASVPIIDCDFPCLRKNETKTKTDNFIAFIYRLLHLIALKLSHIDRFCISTSEDLPGKAIVSSWISTVVCYNVKELSIALYPNHIPVLSPLSLFNCKSLVVLNLEGKFYNNVPQYVNLPSLKTLSLAMLVIQDGNSLTRLISGCPVLEDLSCYNMEHIKVFDVSSPSLKKFVFRTVCGDCELIMKTPNLKIFNFSGYVVRGCSGDAFNSPIEATIFVNLGNRRDVSQGKVMHEIITKASNARKLVLYGDTMEGLAYARQSLPNFHALTHLDLVDVCKGWVLPHLLERSPCIETLIIWGCSNEHGEFPLPRVPICFSMHLKTIQLNWFCANEEEFMMVEYILENAKVLEDMLINTGTVGMRPDSERFHKISARLLDFPTHSKICRILLNGLHLCGK